MKTFPRLFAAIAITAFLVISGPIGCSSRLAPGGAYAKAGQAPDKAFFVADAAYDLAYSAVDAAFTFERDNRQALWQISPAIKHGLDKIRPTAKEIAVEWAKARREYKQNPTPAGLTKLQTILARMQQISNASKAVLPKR